MIDCSLIRQSPGFSRRLRVLATLERWIVGHEDAGCIFYGMVENVLYLQFILVVAVCVTQMAKLIRQTDAFLYVLRGDKVFGYFDAGVKVPHLQKKQ